MYFLLHICRHFLYKPGLLNYICYLAQDQRLIL